jgi:hypothetical protein
MARCGQAQSNKERRSRMTDITVPADMLTAHWAMYPLAAIAVIVAIWAFFIIRHKLR